MENKFSESAYEDMIGRLFSRFPSFQKVGAGAYKPGIANMEFADQMMGHPHREYKIIHVAGTNGKGSVSNMLASVLASQGYRVGLYTSPHIMDFRERIRIISSDGNGRNDESYSLVSKEYVWSFVCRWQDTFDYLGMSFFEITTLMAMQWFADEKADIVVLETGLGGRLDSTNIVTPVLSVITNIGLDHCDLLGDTLAEIAFEKAGIIKPGVPVVVGESNPETEPVFERKVLYVNLQEPEFMGNRNLIMSLLTFADKVVPELWDRHEHILSEMDLRGEYQSRNLRTVLSALDALRRLSVLRQGDADQADAISDAIVNTALRTGFRGRWEKLSDEPYVICDIGHNEHGLRYNFRQLEKMLQDRECSHLIMLYGSVADKDVDAVVRLMPQNAVYVFTQAQGKRSLPASELRDRYMAFCESAARQAGNVFWNDNVNEALEYALGLMKDIVRSDPQSRPLLYIGGSTYVVSEALSSGLVGSDKTGLR